MTRAIFQAGVSWALVDAKWEAFRTAFADFDPARVASFEAWDVDRLLADPGILRSRRKIEATIHNARTLIEIERDGGVGAYLEAFPSYAQASSELRRRFRYLGELSVYYLLFRTGHRVIPFEEWEKTVEGDHPRMREMVRYAREHA